jgi:septal ring factor EnvC (AmiA/AmiB activator)
MLDTILTEGEPDVRASKNLEADIDLLENEIMDATDTERGCLAMLDHLAGDPGADPAAVAALEQQLGAAKAELDKLEADLIKTQSKRDQRAKVVAEIFDTEDDLANDLKLCIRGYVGPSL